MQKIAIWDQNTLRLYVIYISHKGTREKIPAALAPLLGLEIHHPLLSKRWVWVGWKKNKKKNNNNSSRRVCVLFVVPFRILLQWRKSSIWSYTGYCMHPREERATYRGGHLSHVPYMYGRFHC